MPTFFFCLFVCLFVCLAQMPSRQSPSRFFPRICPLCQAAQPPHENVRANLRAVPHARVVPALDQAVHVHVYRAQERGLAPACDPARLSLGDAHDCRRAGAPSSRTAAARVACRPGPRHVQTTRSFALPVPQAGRDPGRHPWSRGHHSFAVDGGIVRP